MRWTRYLVIDYEATQWPFEDEKTGRPMGHGQSRTCGMEADRDKLAWAGYDQRRKMITCGIELHWSLCDVTDPYPLPEEPKKFVRSSRDIDARSGED